MEFISTTHAGFVRNENQDYLGNLKTENGHIFIVCDGIGGLPKGALASRVAVESILSDFSGSIDDPKNILQQSLSNAHQNVYKASNKLIGTTVTALYLEKGTAFAAWCGDSRIYQFQDHRIKWMSRDHNVLHDILNRGKGKGDVFQNPEAITRFLGRTESHQPEFFKFHVNIGDIVLLCSDGLHRFIMEPEIIQSTTNFSLFTANDMLEKRLLSEEVGAPDNFTWYIIHI